MAKLKSTVTLLGLFAIGLVTILAVFVMALDEDDHGVILSWAIAQFTDYTIIVDGSFTFDLSMMSVLTLKDVQIEPDKETVAPLSAQVGDLKIIIDIKPLLSGIILVKELAVEDTVLSFNAPSATTEGRNQPRLGDVYLPIFEKVTLKNIGINYLPEAADKHQELTLHSLIADDLHADDAIHIIGNGSLNNTDFAIQGQLGSLAEALKHTQAYPVDLRLDILDARLALTGTIDDPLEGEGLNIRVTLEETDLSKLLSVVGIDIPELGDVSMEGTVIGNLETPGIMDFYAEISEGHKVEFSVKGQISDLLGGTGADVEFAGKSTNKNILSKLLPQDQYDLTAFNFAGRYYTDNDNRLLEGLRVSATDEAGTTVDVKGNIVFGGSFAAPEPKKTDLSVELTALNTAPLKSILFDWLPDTGPLSGEMKLVGSGQQVALENLNVTAGDPKTVWATVQGRVGTIPFQPGALVTDIDLSVSLKSADTSLLFAGLDLPLPKLDTAVADLQIKGSADHLTFDELDIQMTDPAGVKALVSGSVNMDQGDDELLFKYALDVDMKASNITAFHRLLAAKTLPDLGPVHALAHIEGTTESMSMKNLDIKAGYPGPVRLLLSGNAEKIIFDDDQPVSDANIISSFSADSTSVLSKYLDVPVPDLGPLESKFKLAFRKGGGYGVEDAEIVIGSKEDRRLLVRGRTEYFMRNADVAMSGMDIAIEMNDLDWKVISGLLAEPVPELGQINGTFSVSGSPENLSVSNADISSRSPTGLEIKASGTVTDIRINDDWPFGDANARLSVTAPDAADIGLLMGTELPLYGDFAFNGQFTSNKGEEDIAGQVSIGDTQLQLAIKEIAARDSSHIMATVSSDKIYLADLGIYPRPLPGSSAKSDKTPTSKDVAARDAKIFSDESLPFERLKDHNLSLKLDVKELIGKDFVLADLDVDASLVDGILQINPARLAYADGYIAIEAKVDASTAPPEIMLKMTTKDIDVAGLLAHIPAPAVLGGHFNLVADLNSSGSSPKDIAASLNGELGVGIENGKIKRIADLIGADAIDILASVRSLNKYETLNCLAVFLSFDDGLGTLTTMVMDTPKYRYNGMGKMDLGEETVDIGINPRAKSRRLIGSSPLQIKGSFTALTFRKLPTKEAAELYGTIFLPFVFIPARALGILWHTMGNDKSEPTPCLLPENE